MNDMSNMYGSYSDQEDVVTIPRNKISDNVVLYDLEYSNEKIEKLAFKFKRQMGTTTQMLNVDILPIKRWDNQTDEKFSESIQNWNARIKHISTKFDATKEELEAATADSKSFVDFSTKFIKFIKPRLDGRKMYMKTWNKDDKYTILPRYGNFLQLMSDGEITLSYSDYEKNEMKEISNPPTDNSVNTDEIQF